MKFSYLGLPAILITLMLFLSGCGEKTVGVAGSSKLEQSQTCIDCHQGALSPGTGNSIVLEWKLSHHNSMNGAGCADCHEPEAGHPTSCNRCHSGTPAGSPGSANHVSINPDQDGKCDKCHSKTNGLYPTSGVRQAHFANPNFPVAFGGYTAAYVSTNYIGNCRKCHNPHDTSSNRDYNRAWAKSGHGKTAESSRVSRDFKLFGTDQPANLAYTNSSPAASTDPIAISKGTPVCVRCHTTTGYLNFIKSNFTNVNPFGSNTDKSKEVTGCDACHTNYSFKLNAVPQVTIYYNFSGATQPSAGNPSGHAKIQNNPVKFPNFGQSNLCIPCHAGRGVGSTIKILDGMGVDFTKINSPSSHDFSGAAVLTTKSGYEFSGNEYTIGVGANTGHDTTGLNTGKGPCITCHMNKSIKSDSHTFKPVVHGNPFSIYTTVGSWTNYYSVPAAPKPQALTISSIPSLTCNTSGCHTGFSASTLTTDKQGYISALAALNKWSRLVRNVPKNPQISIGIPSYDSTKDALTYPNAARSTTQWDYLGVGTGADLMGSAFNLSTLNNEPGAYVHNPLYAKRLIFDSIYFLATRATNPALGTKQYPVNQQLNVADAIYYLISTTARTLETGPVYSGAGSTASTKAATTIEVRATIPTQLAESAIQWLYGKPYSALTPAEKLIRPGGI